MLLLFYFYFLSIVSFGLTVSKEVILKEWMNTSCTFLLIITFIWHKEVDLLNANRLYTLQGIFVLCKGCKLSLMNVVKNHFATNTQSRARVKRKKQYLCTWLDDLAELHLNHQAKGKSPCGVEILLQSEQPVCFKSTPMFAVIAKRHSLKPGALITVILIRILDLNCKQ